ncbi:ATP-dependent DNA helicase RecG [Spongiibacter sp. KMU-158]|uniref:ATP-dependent DNA helicase RecG n=1 Tax=Spongiibacter pelagi TaxID=2760804 RepID=A0A927BZQ7_9GAMM|nr:ATP-dependent DNA helicase RecG [Spongiibacter pelagi]MBD2857528.1 ATP-dependent DNA helicase RecG [Spongiibacter pelagi]
MGDYIDQISVASLKGVGPRLQEKLAQLGINNVQDLLFHLPLRYQDRTRLCPIGSVQLGSDVVIEGKVVAADIVFGRRRSLVCRIQDGTGTTTLRFFHFNAAQKQQLAPGTRLRCFGEARRGSGGLEFYHPEYRVLQDHETAAMEEALTPIYPSTEGLQQASWRKLLDQALLQLDRHPVREWLKPEQLPPELRRINALGDALRYLHNPPVDASLQLIQQQRHPCQQRLAFEELLAHNLALQQLREQARALSAPCLDGPIKLETQFLAQLGFTLTGAQQRVASEISTDLKRYSPMLRLVQGDVGSGKTAVAALAALRAVASGYQVAIMAPTEILAEQHYQNFSQWLEPLGIQIAWLSGKQKGKAREKQQQSLAEHHAHIGVGTHALFQDDVEFAKLGLVIIDEQHRFGVHQRLALKQKAEQGVGQPHQLIMTATPIPRTLAMTAYADLDTSIIDELPPGRSPVNTVVLENTRRTQVIERLRAVCTQGQQAYWVCTLIEESDKLQAQAAEASWELLREQLPELTVGLVHGRLKPQEKAEIMARFKAGEIQLLVATIVIEVGVDVPNASLMIIENAERLGLAQLHQLRGRVGRGSLQSHCVLMYQTPLSRNGRERLSVLRSSNDGFVIAEEDLRIRGPGEVLGTRQTGLMSFKIADLQEHDALLEPVRDTAINFLHEHPIAAQALIDRWLANKTLYASV